MDTLTQMKSGVMGDCRHSYINGKFVEPDGGTEHPIINPADGQVSGTLVLAPTTAVDDAVAAARAAWPAYANTSREQRIGWLKAIAQGMVDRADDLAAAVTRDMGAPRWLATKAHVPSGVGHIKTAAKILETYEFDSLNGTTMVTKEPMGVCGFITPWNWPLNQICCKLAPVLATGSVVVWKPSEFSAYSSRVLAEIIDAAGLPDGVFNMVYGDGPTVGAAIAAHPDIDMVSFTGSTRAGTIVAETAAPSVKRVHQELGGKSPCIITPCADLEAAVKACTRSVFTNSGQTCTAPTRMLVPMDKMDQAAEIAAAVAAKTTPGNPDADDMVMGPVVNRAQRDKIRDLIQKGIDEGAKLAAGGPDHPDDVPDDGFYVKPTVFSHVTNDMIVAREEIFGPVVSIIGYNDLEDAIRIGNDTPYGLAGEVYAGSDEVAQNVGRKIRAGRISLNSPAPDLMAPFGGYKQSGNGREWGKQGFDEFVEIKSIIGFKS